ncbi:transcriptional regulator NrdR [Spectribacter hydrogenoxidans]|uniref:Transcriptional repressor NrdR n=1 Tax=Spectribacter hydrogenoxidans TaxID=3075608 RepID=A0ABU3C182_9GAMM|nr:transcriptional regulator NrdR [Salinisphaera sp. W335]MDT0635119.1 transcriptional regulator NrdR [Salinisphaera sp. W335]
MLCPFCNAEATRVVDSRLAAEGSQVRRRRECPDCGSRFTTFENAELVLPRIAKNDGTPEPFDEAKLRRGIDRALYKRPVSAEAVDAAVSRIRQRLRTDGERDVPSRRLGNWVMEELRELDQVAFVRFASVYRRFEDVNAFREEIERLEATPGPEAARAQLSLIGSDSGK